MRKSPKIITVAGKRTITVRHVKVSRSEEIVDERVTEEANDDSAWEESVEVHRRAT
jgi:hypothetical protein